MDSFKCPVDILSRSFAINWPDDRQKKNLLLQDVLEHQHKAMRYMLNIHGQISAENARL